ncbi:MAG: hypothetical protein PHD65_10925 [Gallionella sp.]|nr:hypothetical protein [Gallionella sp.]
MFILGIIGLIAAFLLLLFNLKTSYDTQGGAIGQNPVFGASIVQIPLLVLLGLGLIDKSGRLHLEGWHYLIIWLVLAVCIGSLVAWFGNLAKPRKP